jgi:DNA-binding HxlR family transcriptional regulator
VTGVRSYADPCGIARALDLVGERWALLVVRELLLGPKRFTDLRAGLPGTSQNVLAERLRGLETAGVVRRRRLPTPARIWVYELTDWGLELEPVILALGRWGSRAASLPPGELSVDALMIALKTTFDAQAAANLRATFELRLGEERFRVQVANRRLELTRGNVEQPDATLHTDAATLRKLVFGDRQLDAALSVGDVTVSGDRPALSTLLKLFPRPAALTG